MSEQLVKQRSLSENAIEFSKGLDVLTIAAGIGVTAVNPALGGVIIGGGIISLEAGRRAGYELNKLKTNKPLGERAIRGSKADYAKAA